MNAKISVFVICVKAITCFLLHIFHTYKGTILIQLNQLN